MLSRAAESDETPLEQGVQATFCEVAILPYGRGSSGGFCVRNTHRLRQSLLLLAAGMNDTTLGQIPMQHGYRVCPALVKHLRFLDLWDAKFPS